MASVNIHEAKTHFSKLLQRVATGEEIIIANRGVPVAKLVPVAQHHGKRQLGLAKGRLKIADDFDAPLPPEILEGFYGGPLKELTAAPVRAKKSKQRKVS